MRTAICYHSTHHGNTQKVLEAMAQGNDVDLIDVAGGEDVDLDAYDVIGFASGIYGFAFDESVMEFLRKNLPRGKKVFFVYTYSGIRGTGAKKIREAAEEKGASILGEYSCHGFTTFGPFKLGGGVFKGHPDQKELDGAKAFYQSIMGQQ